MMRAWVNWRQCESGGERGRCGEVKLREFEDQLDEEGKREDRIRMTFPFLH